MDIARFSAELINSGLLAPAHAVAMAEGVDGADTYRKLLEICGLRSSAFADCVAEAHGIRRVDLDDLRSRSSLAENFSLPFMLANSLYPYRAADGTSCIAVADPALTDAIDAIKLTLGPTAETRIASFEDIEIVLAQGRSANAPTADDAPDDDSKADDIDSLRDLASGAPVVRALDDIFDRAVAARATDIHIEPSSRDFRVRLRIDGVMRSLPQIRGIPHRALISRVKILSGINIAERRVPQDGRARIASRGREFDIRVATMPTSAGEAAILRLLERGNKLVEFGQFGFSARDDAVLRQQLAMPHGLFIVTGPTGSGKTTTLAAAIALLNDSTRKILTIEDPVEYEIAGVSQSQVRQAVGLTFASALKAFLRQDPDVIMVGEIRDAETAKIAIQAALTGHLVMSTLHTNSAASAVTRLIDIGVEPYLIASTLTTVVGQRLVRMLCPDCRGPIQVSEERRRSDPRLSALNVAVGTTMHEPGGCERCSQLGYRGRRAIFEVLEVRDQVRRMILSSADDNAIEQAARNDGMTTMVEDGLARCVAGVTSLDEIFRVAALHAS